MALLLFGAYRGVGEKLIFNNAQPTMGLADVQTLAYRLVRAELLGLRESFVQSASISFRSLGNLELLSWQALIVAAGLLIGGAAIYVCVRTDALPNIATPGLATRRGPQRPRWSGVFIAAIGIYLLSNTIFVLSFYVPNSSGFESRTQGAIRFAVALVIATGAKLLHHAFVRRRFKELVALGAAALYVIFGASVVGQREAWVAAAQYNAQLLEEMDAAIQRAKLNEQLGFTFVADLPTTFPRQVNDEPLFGQAWDLGPALALLYPRSTVRANVYEPVGTIIQTDKVVLHGYWEARYPFYFYRFGDGSIYSIENARDFAWVVRR